MNLRNNILINFILFTFLVCCQLLPGQSKHELVGDVRILDTGDITFGSDQFILADSIWAGKSIALVVNHSSVLSNGKHLVDALHQHNAKIVRIYAPEHGFRGQADAGETIKSGVDTKTNIPIRSLYGDNKKPSLEEIQEVDLIIFDIQDVGVRFYTYLSTMYYVMEVAAEARTRMYVLDRPNPNGFYVDGPVLDTNFRSFVGIIPIPIVHGMTLGELAMMIKGDSLIDHALHLPLTVIPCKGYTHQSSYVLPIPPSPNLPNLRSILLYPSLCYFEACQVSVGRGTDQQFQQIGSPFLKGEYDYKFIPQPMPGARHPKFQGDTCYGIDLSDIPLQSIVTHGHIQWDLLFDLQTQFEEHKMVDREQFMDLLMGTDAWRKYVYANDKKGWKQHYQRDLEIFKINRKKYLLYPE